MSDRLTPLQMVKIAATAECSIQTVQRYLSGTKVRPMTKIALTAAAEKLGIRLPDVSAGSSQ